MTKPFKTLDEQIEILRSRNLNFLDVGNAKKILSRYGYYEIINGYKDFLLISSSNEEDVFQDEATFEHIYALYKLDKQLRNAVLESMIEAEYSLKTALAYNIAGNIGTDQAIYLNRRHYRNGKPNYKGGKVSGYKIDQLIFKFERIANDDVEPMKHYRNEHGNVPPWILFKGATFGNIVNFISLQKSSLKAEIYSTFSGLPVEMFVDESLRNMYSDIIFLLLMFRNRSAHGGRIYNYKSNKSKIRYNKMFHDRMKISNADYRIGKGQGDICTLLNALSWLENELPEFNLEFNIHYPIQQHLRLYPEDKHMLIDGMGFAKDFKIREY